MCRKTHRYVKITSRKRKEKKPHDNKKNSHENTSKNERKSLLAERLRTKENTKNTLIIRFVSVFTL